MTVNSTRNSNNIIPWGWKKAGNGATGVHVKYAGSATCQVHHACQPVANSDFPPIGEEEAVTSDLGIALLSRIAGL
jgi:hypothetical protein